MRVFSRSLGHSAVAAAAYRAGACLKDERTGAWHRYENRHGMKGDFILVPADGIPEKFLTRAFLWNAVEASEPRKNARVARELILALPHELSDKAREELARDMGLYLVERYRVAVDGAIHSPVDGDGHDPRNHHAHLLFSTRVLTSGGFGAKTRVLDDKITGPQETEIIRQVWETLANDALARAGFPHIKIDRRTLEAQGIDRIPQTHEGKAARNADPGHDDPAPESLLAQDFRKADKDDEDDSGDEDGDGKQGSGSSGRAGGGSSSSGSGQPPALQSKVREDHKGRKIDYPAIDGDKTRTGLNGEIKAINEKRAAFGEKPLIEQIAQLDRLTERLDRRVEVLEAIKARTSLPAVMKNTIASAVKLAADLFTKRRETGAVLLLTAEEKQARRERQIARYGRAYRTGIHEQIREMKQNMAIVEAKREDFRRYKSFVDKIGREIKQYTPVPMAASFKTQSLPLRTTNREVNLKLHLKAEMVRSQIPEKYRASSPLKGERKTLTTSTAVNKILQATKALIRIDRNDLVRPQPPPRTANPDPAARQNWFIPASANMRPLQRSIEAHIKVQQQAMPRQLPSTSDNQNSFLKAQDKPPKMATYKQVREKIRLEAEAKRAQIPPEYRAEPYESQGKVPEQSGEAVDKQATTSATFGQESAAPDAVPNQPKPARLRMSDTFNMKSGATDTGQNQPQRNPEETPEMEI